MLSKCYPRQHGILPSVWRPLGGGLSYSGCVRKQWDGCLVRTSVMPMYSFAPIRSTVVSSATYSQLWMHRVGTLFYSERGYVLRFNALFCQIKLAWWYERFYHVPVQVHVGESENFVHDVLLLCLSERFLWPQTVPWDHILNARCALR